MKIQRTSVLKKKNTHIIVFEYDINKFQWNEDIYICTRRKSKLSLKVTSLITIKTLPNGHHLWHSSVTILYYLAHW